MKPLVYIETTIPSFYYENCRHLANANKFNHIRCINAMLGLYVPIMATPLELLGGIENAEG